MATPHILSIPENREEVNDRTDLVPDVSIIIVSYNTLAYLQQSISSVARGFRRYTTEIIVVDNGSTDGSLEYLVSLPYIRLITNSKNLGFPEANNQALKVARGKHYYLLNSDAFFHEACGDLQMDFILAHSEVGLVTPTFEYLNGSWQQSFGDFPTLWRGIQNLLGKDILLTAYYSLMHQQRVNLKPRRVDYGEGAGLLIRGEVKRDIGGLSTDYFFYGDDIDYALRAAKAGWQTWWVPQACLTHVRGGSLKMKDFEAGLERQFTYFMRFWVFNYSPTTVRWGFIFKCLYWQRMVWGALCLAWMPKIGEWVKGRLQRYRVARDLHWCYFPRNRFHKLIEKVKDPDICRQIF